MKPITPAEQIISNILDGQHAEILRLKNHHRCTLFYCLDLSNNPICGLVEKQRVIDLLSSIPNIDLYEVTPMNDVPYNIMIIKDDVGNMISKCNVDMSILKNQVVIFLNESEYLTVDELIASYNGISVTKKNHYE